MQEPESRNRCRGHRGVLHSGLLPLSQHRPARSNYVTVSPMAPFFPPLYSPSLVPFSPHLLGPALQSLRETVLGRTEPPPLEDPLAPLCLTPGWPLGSGNSPFGLPQLYRHSLLLPFLALLHISTKMSMQPLSVLLCSLSALQMLCYTL